MEQYDDDDEESLSVEFEDGHWEWDDRINQLVFISHIITTEEQDTVPITIDFGSLQFKEDIDLFEQQRFRKYFQGKTTATDVVTLQNVRDVALFTAPRVLLKPAVINILHLPTMDRFLRALIIYCQYYLQVTDEMTCRMIESLSKIRTRTSDSMEAEFQDNLADLRVLILKEYTVMIMGESDFKKFHHMGPTKHSKSMSKKDTIVFESVLRIAIQIVWIALGRKSFNQIEVEIHRIFKSQTFNLAERKLNLKDTDSPEERSVLKGQCIPTAKKILTQSPLMNELFCERKVDYRMYGLGVVNFQRLDFRLHYMELVLIIPETKIKDTALSIGILGLPRTNFDIMLKVVAVIKTTTASSMGTSGMLGKRMSTVKSKSSYRKSTTTGAPPPLYGPIRLPGKSSRSETPLPEFPTERLPDRKINHRQRRLWLKQTTKRQYSKRK